MAIQTMGQDGSTLVAVDPQHLAQRVSLRPVQVLGWYSLALSTGLLTGASLSSVLFSLRNGAPSNLLMVRRVGIGWAQTTAFTTAQRLEFQLAVCRAFTVADTGGQAVAMGAANIGKHRTSFASPSVADVRISTTGILGSSGSKVIDAWPIGLQWLFSGAAGTGMQASPNNLFSHDTGDHPLILAPNEGLNILNGVAMGAAGVGILYVNIEFAEVAAY